MVHSRYVYRRRLDFNIMQSRYLSNDRIKMDGVNKKEDIGGLVIQQSGRVKLFTTSSHIPIPVS